MGTNSQQEKWKQSLHLFASAACLVLLINISFLAWAASKGGIRGGKGVLYDSSCPQVRRANIGIHLLINILSTILLGASNYCMQCLAAPSRSEIETAHKNGGYLDIGIPSLHNIGSAYLDSRKKALWWILGLSSLPLHLCYNSAVFSSTSAQTYGVFQIGPKVMGALNGNTYNISDQTVGGDAKREIFSLYLSATQKSTLEQLDNKACINAYSRIFQSTKGNVYLVPVNNTPDVRDLTYEYPTTERSTGCGSQVGNEWIVNQFLAGGCRNQNAHIYLPLLQANASDWRPLGARIDHCLSEPAKEHCKLQFSAHLIIIVIVFNILKTAVILLTAFWLKQTPLLTVGDAVSSFLQQPDLSTADMCLVSQKEVWGSRADWRAQKLWRQYTGVGSRWFSAVKRGKLITCIIALFIGIMVMTALLAWGYSAIPGTKDFKSVLSSGLGTLDSRTIIQSGTTSTGTRGIFQNVFLANAPQVIISIIYFSYNAVITSMLLAYEWDGYSKTRKGLRVSTKQQGAQRSTYFLQLPYRYAVPLMVFSTVIHWLASQSIFVVSVELYNMFGEHRER
ncbi:uncharacterized protein BDR25DRAFT_375874 [Lindgomyces ingoldianus]|uniref:Uncharacterized protein n=1 Tax=Lindgomyces ingoldianus TaxID=673940 RepID=A0ACB6RC52_9PLEO|nr:uncharacterized protein BDR25DRAFT_375874 [Lindgomyces ingoldianus]KAF2476761.1 hypothetical protein BDR25DRAFT_375874 [Lindgomyces ingoldianus]